MSSPLISSAVFKALTELDAETPASLQWVLHDVIEQGPQLVHSRQASNDFAGARLLLSSALRTRLSFASEEEFLFAMRCLVVRMGLSLAKGIGLPNGIPASVQALYPSSFSMLASYLKSRGMAPYMDDIDFLSKDVRFVMGLTVPCGAQVVDLSSRVAPGMIVKHFVRTGRVRDSLLYMRTRGIGTWYRTHTESRNLRLFNEEGWTECYLRVSEMLQLNQRVCGLTGTSWYYDPRVETISPNLSFLRQPLRYGAFLVRHRTTERDIQLALLSSARRRALYHAKEYIPVSYSLIWPRNDLLKWAEIKKRTWLAPSF